MTIKQYGSLTLDLNTVKQSYQPIDKNLLLIRLHDGNQITLLKEWHSQFTKDYQEFTLQKKTQVIKEAFEYVFDTEFQLTQHSENYPTAYTLNSKQFWVYFRNNNSFCCSTRQTGNVEGKLNNFDFNSTDKVIWISYAQQIKDKYLDSIVDPIKVTNQVLKFRKLDKDWKVFSTKTRLNTVSINLIKNDGKEYFSLYATTNSEWIEAMEFVLDKYYESVQPSEVDLKLMLGKALKDNNLVAKEVTINLDSNCPNKISLTINNDKLKWLDLNTNQIAVYANELSQPIGVYSYTNLKDWEVILFDSLNQYKQLSKLTSFKLTKEFLNKESTLIDLIKQAFPNYNLEFTSKRGNYKFYKGNKNDYYITVEILNDSNKIIKDKVASFIVLNHNGSYCHFNLCAPYNVFTKENLINYTNWEQWLEDLIKVKQNLKDLEQSPNLIVKELNKAKQLPQRKSVWTEQAREKYNSGEDPWL